MTQSNDASSSEEAQNNSTLGKAYDPSVVESRWYETWDTAGYFKPSPTGKPYVIVVPPPNVTGSLHMGHALNQTLQDVLTRFHRMAGRAALWVPGTDHGGIATQNVVERLLLKEGTSRHKLGRTAFLERMWAWRKEAGDTILMQAKRLGASMDWSKYRFTMDDVCSKAVRVAFVELYRRKLLYRGKRLVNWCPRCSTALADIEVEHSEVKGSLWHIRYPLIERRKTGRAGAKKSKTVSAFDSGYLIVATTRPETMLGDTAVAVNPKDKRYKEVMGGTVRLPLINREIPIVADDVVDKSFGTGAVKVTPAHDPTDFEIAERKGLPHINVIGFDGKMTDAAGPQFAGMDRFDARKIVVEELEKQGLLEKVEDYKLSVSVCYRCDSVIEPLESEQWFLSMRLMAKRAREANKKGKVKIIPESWEGPYQLWLRNLKDWCVSRQIWWGHRIPVWYCLGDTEKAVTSESRSASDNASRRRDDNILNQARRSACPPIVSVEEPASCPACKSTHLEQEDDVLDTWFSSALWPFSVFAWPETTSDLKRFFPTTVLVTGHEILYLWVARMIMFGLEFMGKVPFSSVLIHGIVRDKKGRKMSKSLGNVIDPLELIQEFGADAVRFSLAQSAAPGRDMQISKDNFVAARNFSNKVWNATRFVLMRLGEMKSIPPLSANRAGLELSDKWILHRYNEVITETTESLERLDMDTASRGLYNFFWADFCDWYLEMVKPRVDREHYAEIPCSNESSQAARTVLATVLEGTLRLLHPFIPFITEELWQKVPKPATSVQHLIVSTWPGAQTEFIHPDSAERMRIVQEMVTKLRTIRSEMGIQPHQSIDVIAKLSSPETEKLVKSQEVILKCLNSRVGKLVLDGEARRPKASASAVIPGADLYVPLEGLIDFTKERARLEKESGALKQDVERLSKKMSNADFLSHAPAEEVDKAKERLAEAIERVRHLEENISTLS